MVTVSDEFVRSARRRCTLIAQLQARVYARDRLIDTGVNSEVTRRLDALSAEIDSLLEELWHLSHPAIPTNGAVQQALKTNRTP